MLNHFLFRSKKSKDLAAKVYRVTGVTPGKIRIYREALKHSSTTRREDTDNVVDNERLEFLGDAILDAVIAELLSTIPQKRRRISYRNENQNCQS